MPEETPKDVKKTLDLIHIIYILIVIGIGVGIAWGTVTTKQKSQQKEIDNKLSKEVFEVHQQEQRIATKSLQDTLNKGFDRLEKRME